MHESSDGRQSAGTLMIGCTLAGCSRSSSLLARPAADESKRCTEPRKD